MDSMSSESPSRACRTMIRAAVALESWRGIMAIPIADTRTAWRRTRHEAAPHDPRIHRPGAPRSLDRGEPGARPDSADVPDPVPAGPREHLPIGLLRSLPVPDARAGRGPWNAAARPGRIGLALRLLQGLRRELDRRVRQLRAADHRLRDLHDRRGVAE